MTPLSATRLAAARKGQFVPTPLEAVDLIASSIFLEPAPPKILDPSCGEGIALARLGAAWDGETWGNELERNRYDQAKEILHHCTLGPQETLDVVGEFDVIFMNPPYDLAGPGQRLEVEHVRQARGWLRTGGVLIAVVPQHILTRPGWWRMWNTLLWNTHVRRFPDHIFDAFKQHVVFGVKRDVYEPALDVSRLAQQYRDSPAEPLTGEQLLTLRVIPAWKRVTRVESTANKLPSAGEIIQDVAQLPDLFDTPEFKTLTIPPDHVGGGRPAMPVRATHVIQLAAAGMMNGQEMNIDGETYLVSGASCKYKTKTRKEEPQAGGKVKTTTVETEKSAYQIMGLSLENGRFFKVDSRETEPYQAFIKGHVGALIDTANAANPPQYEMDYSRWVGHFDRIHSPRKLPGREADGLLTAQKHIAAALLKVFERSNSAILDGSMGTGKTLTSLAAMVIVSGMLDGKAAKIVVLCPSVVAPKWVEEAQNILREVPNLKVGLIGQERKRKHAAPVTGKAARALFKPGYTPPLHHKSLMTELKRIKKPILDARELMEHDGPAILVLTYETAKNGAPWEHAVGSRRRTVKWTEKVVEEDRWGDKHTRHVEHEEERTVYYCPDCHHELFDEESGKPWDTDTELIPGDHPNKRLRAKRKKQTCPKCGAQLWQQTPFKYGGRYPLAEYISQRYGGKYYLIVDEVHTTQSGSSDVGYASADLIYNATKTVAMTGTIFNGLARSLFYILYRMDAGFRKLYAHHEANLFVSHHGFVEIITTETRVSHGYSGYGREKTYTREAPGATPAMVSMLMPITCFLTLDDIGVDLPPLNEYVVPVEVCEEMRPGLRKLDAIEQAAKQRLATSNGRNKALHSRWFQAALGWPDNPVSERISDGDEGYGITGVPAGVELPKDKTLLNLIYENLEQGRGVAVFFEQVNRRNATPRVQQFLENKGIYSAMLTASIKPENRIPWIKKHVAVARRKGQELVLLANGNLVKEGVDLLEFPTIVEVGQHYIITNLQQRLRRSWRLGQTKEVRLYYLFYAGTLQEQAIHRIAKKLKAAKQIDGQVAEGLADYGDDEDFIQDLMRAAQTLEGGRIAELMQVRVVEDRNKPVFGSNGTKPKPVVVVPESVSEVVQLSLF